MVFNIIHAWTLEVPAVYLCIHFLNYTQNAVWWSISGATAVSAIIFYAYFRRGKWLDVKV